jgi:hypothetical protein
MTDTVHTIVALVMMFCTYQWGYWRAYRKEHTEGVRFVLEQLKEMGVITDFKVKEVQTTEEDEDVQ